MKKSVYLFSLSLLVAIPPVFAAVDPYENPVFVTNTTDWPYDAEHNGIPSFANGRAEDLNEDSLIMQHVTNHGFHFPSDLNFGVATSAYQYEGNRVAPSADNPDGIGWSMWDVFSQPGSWLNPKDTNILKTLPTSDFTKPSGEDAVKGFYPAFYQQDIDTIEKLGVNYYRLSISWPRLFPHANMDKPDPEGVKYYTDVIKYLRSKNINVLITLYHWDMPAWLYNFGDNQTKNKTYGWIDMSDAKDNLAIKEFQKYTAAVYRSFGKYTPYFSTFNEPLTFTNNAFTDGGHAPGQYGWDILRQQNPALYGANREENLQRLPYLQAINLVKAHYIAYKTIHHLYETEHISQQKPEVTIVLNSDWAEPYRVECDDQQENCHYNPQDIQASKNNMDYMLGWWLDPVMYGRWPQSMEDTVYSPQARLRSVGIDSRDSSCLRADGMPVACEPNAVGQETLADYIKAGGAVDHLAINHYTGYFAVDRNYAIEHYSTTNQPGAVPPNQYGAEPSNLQTGWYVDQNNFITQFRYNKYFYPDMNNKPELPASRAYVIGNAGNKAWLRQTWFAYRKLLQYIDTYYLQETAQNIGKHGHRVTTTKQQVKFKDLAIYLTENGTSVYQESQQPNMTDSNRIEYILGNLGAVEQAINQDKINVKLYTYWSFSDNFEWAEGYDSRFGLINIDYANGFARHPKQSYYCLQQLIKLKDKGTFPEECAL